MSSFIQHFTFKMNQRWVYRIYKDSLKRNIYHQFVDFVIVSIKFSMGRWDGGFYTRTPKLFIFYLKQK